MDTKLDFTKEDIIDQKNVLEDHCYSKSFPNCNRVLGIFVRHASPETNWAQVLFDALQLLDLCVSMAASLTYKKFRLNTLKPLFW